MKQPEQTETGLTGEVDHGFMRGDGPLLKEELVEVFAARCQNSFVGAVLLSFDQQGDVTELVAEALAVEFVQHGLTVFGQELVHLTLTVHLEKPPTETRLTKDSIL